MSGLQTATCFMDVYPKRPFILLIIDPNNGPLKLPKKQQVATGNPPPPLSIMHTKIDEPSYYWSYMLVTEFINVVHYKPKPERWQQMQGHAQVTEEVNIRLQKDWLDEMTVWDGQKSTTKPSLGQISKARHITELTFEDTRPVYSAPYRTTSKHWQFEGTRIDKVLGYDVIKTVTTEWSRPTVMNAMKDGSLRFCIECRELNAITVADSYLLPHMDEYIDSLGEATIFSTVDVSLAWWQIEMDPKDRDQNTFRNQHGFFQSTRMLSGIRSAAATFQRAVDIIVSAVKWKPALVCLDEIVFFMKIVKEHMLHHRQVLTLLRDSR